MHGGSERSRRVIIIDMTMLRELDLVFEVETVSTQMTVNSLHQLRYLIHRAEVNLKVHVFS